MASRQIRQKEGILELKKSDGMKKAWKPYTFKLTSTYLLYYKTDPAKPDGQTLLAHVTQVQPSNSKGGSYAFEVIHRGKGSPWKLNASSNEDRISWMEAILPGSGKLLTNFKKKMEAAAAASPPNYITTSQNYSTLPPPEYTHTYTDTSPPYTNTASTKMTSPSSPSISTAVAHNSHAATTSPLTPNSALQTQTQTQSSKLEERDELTASLPTSGGTAQEYLVPVGRNIRSSHTMKETSTHKKETGRPVPAPRRRTVQVSSTPPSHPENGSHFSQRGQRGGNEYTILMSSQTTQPQSPTSQTSQPRIPQPASQTSQSRSPTSQTSHPAPSQTSQSKRASSIGQSQPVSQTSPPSQPQPSPAAGQTGLRQDSNVSDYISIISHDDDGIAVDEDNYVIADISQDGSETEDFEGTPQSPGKREGEMVGGRVQQKEPTTAASSIAQHFNHDQIEMLIHMLETIKTGGTQATETEIPAVTTAGWGERRGHNGRLAPLRRDSSILQGNLQQALSSAPPELNEKILVTEDQEYEKRPQWAKAARENPCDLQPDPLDNLEQALYLSRSDLTDFKLIGQGQFGKVFKGSLKVGSEPTAVAVKVTRKSSNEYQQQSFIKEMKIMSQLMHPNIVRLYGIVTEDVPSPLIVLEFMKNGDLKNFLTHNKRPVQQLVKYMIDVAMGMHYISERCLVHRDLAARNVLVSENEICKVADFGMLREIPKDESIYQSTHNVPSPVRWMAPESISSRAFSTPSDVWSFGILAWEMFNPTKLPYEKYDNLGCVLKVNEGLRLPIPREAPSIVAKIMKACWQNNPTKRPSFLLISTLLSTRTSF